MNSASDINIATVSHPFIAKFRTRLTQKEEKSGELLIEKEIRREARDQIKEELQTFKKERESSDQIKEESTIRKKMKRSEARTCLAAYK